MPRKRNREPSEILAGLQAKARALNPEPDTPKEPMPKQYPKIDDGEWVQPVTTGYGMACCDCGLVHRLNFRIHDGHIQFQASRDNRATGQLRRSIETVPWSTKEWIATPNHPEAKKLER